MNMKKLFFGLLATALAATSLTSCSDDDDDDKLVTKQGTVNVKMTDAPSDDENIKGTFVTISELKINGVTVEDFRKQTIEISSFQNGETKLMVSKKVDAKTYNSISIELDYEKDASGNAPGCYILTKDDKKHNLSNSSESDVEVSLEKDFTITADQTTDVVIDFDLRKAIERNTTNSETDYSFRKESDMKAALRVVVEAETGTIKGEINNKANAEDHFIVYAYKKGEFNAESETQNSDKMFAKAVTSAKVDSEGMYKLSFLEKGNYEIHVASYTKSEQNANKMQFKGMANASSSVLLNNVAVESNTELTLNIEINFALI